MQPIEQPIQLFVPTFRIDETLDAIRECLEKGWTGLGFKTVQFEQAWKDYTGLPYAHFLNSATAGLHLAVAQLKAHHGWADGDEIITTPLTFVSTNHAILYERLTPVFADVDQYLCLDPESVAARITPRTRAVIFVGMGGNPGSYDAVRGVCNQHGLKLILDAAHMSGTRLHGKHIGYDADATVFSYQAVKNLPTADSGMICWPTAELDAEARKWTWLGINKDTYARTTSGGTYSWYYDVETVGYKYHGNSIMAACALVALKYVDEDNAFRREVCAWYDELLADEPRIERIPITPDCVPSRHLYQVLLDNRDEVVGVLNRAKIYPGVHYRDNTLYGMYRTAHGTCPKAAHASDRLLSLPLHLRLTRADVERVAHELKTAVREKVSAH
ncbi:MAG: DegT/DnrJ/EryC1/StrS family aminotransferase [Anaerolineae bacterium]|nr:DegT/DnrJ/EryC1/StrS family aminotransferase [Anaerolineae bacterium]